VGGLAASLGISLCGRASAQPTLGGPAGSASRAVVGLSPVETMAIVFATTFFVGGSVLLMFPEYAATARDTAMHSPLSTFLLGIPGQLLFVFLYVLSGLLMLGILSFLLAIPLFVATLAVHVAWSALGYVAVGQIIAGRIGWSSAVAGLFVASLLGSVLVFVPVVGSAGPLLFGTLGVGAGLRLQTGFTPVDSSDRRVPGRQV
jgi:hypothetical protein